MKKFKDFCKKGKAKVMAAALAFALVLGAVVSGGAGVAYASEVTGTAPTLDSSQLLTDGVQTGITNGFSQLLSLMFDIIGVILPSALICMFGWAAINLIFKALKKTVSKIG